MPEWPNGPVLKTGAENPQPPCNNKTCGDTSEGACRALCRNRAEIDPALAAIASAWPTLPDALKAGIVAMVKAAEIAGQDGK